MNYLNKKLFFVLFDFPGEGIEVAPIERLGNMNNLFIFEHMRFEDFVEFPDGLLPNVFEAMVPCGNFKYARFKNAVLLFGVEDKELLLYVLKRKGIKEAQWKDKIYEMDFSVNLSK
jgi:hypothetical protein